MVHSASPLLALWLGTVVVITVPCWSAHSLIRPLHSSGAPSVCMTSIWRCSWCWSRRRLLITNGATAPLVLATTAAGYPEASSTMMQQNRFPRRDEGKGPTVSRLMRFSANGALDRGVCVARVSLPVKQPLHWMGSGSRTCDGFERGCWHLFELTGYRQKQRVVDPAVPCSSSLADGRVLLCQVSSCWNALAIHRLQYIKFSSHALRPPYYTVHDHRLNAGPTQLLCLRLLFKG
jgi:hypothetical protein